MKRWLILPVVVLWVLAACSSEKVLTTTTPLPTATVPEPTAVPVPTPPNPPPAFLLTWGPLDDTDRRFRSPIGMTVDGKDTVYVGDLVGGGIQAFTSEGEFLELFARTAGGGVTGLAADSAGNIYAVDKLNDRLTKFDPKGRLELQWGESGSEAGQFSKPWGVAVDPQGNVYVSDTGNSRVQKFDATGIFLTEWGGPGEAQGFFRDIKGIAVNPAGQVLVADTSNNRIQRFTPEGQFIDQ